MRRRKRKTVSGMVKTIPLSIALAALSTGVGFAADGDVYDHVQVELPDGKIAEFDLGLMADDPTYATLVKNTLTAAFERSAGILVQLDEDTWVEFGENAGKGVTLTGMKANPSAYAGTPDPDADFIKPY
jgi:hypothetical protein